MKKAISILLVLLMTLTLCACGTTKSSNETTESKKTTQNVKDDLLGANWNHETRITDTTERLGVVTTSVTDILYSYNFSNSGKFSEYYNLTKDGQTQLSHTRHGTYEIREDTLILSYDDYAEDLIIHHSYEDGKLVLRREWNDELQWLTRE